MGERGREVWSDAAKETGSEARKGARPRTERGKAKDGATHVME